MLAVKGFHTELTEFSIVKFECTCRMQRSGDEFSLENIPFTKEKSSWPDKRSNL